MHLHAQTQVELNRKVVGMLSGSDQHVAITISITTSNTISDLLVYVLSYRDEDHDFTPTALSGSRGGEV